MLLDDISQLLSVHNANHGQSTAASTRSGITGIDETDCSSSKASPLRFVPLIRDPNQLGYLT
jgi:hypothetical protein